MEINLPKDRAYFITRSFWHNSSGIEQPYYHWMNLGVRTRGDAEFIFPGNRQIGHEGEPGDWPVNRANGRRVNFYEQNNFGGYKSYHVIGAYADFFGVYYHKDNNGMVRFGNYDDKMGRKIWIWGLSGQGMIWENILTDNDGQYSEIQSGRLFNQNQEKSSLTPFKQTSFTPYNTDTWEEYWYPVGNTKGFVTADKAGALNVQYDSGWLKLYFSAAEYIQDTLRVTVGKAAVYNRLIKLAPLDVFVDSVQLSSGRDSIYVNLGRGKITYSLHNGENVLSRPVQAPDDFDWQSAYGLYMMGKEYMGLKMFEQAAQKLTASLKKDPNYLPALVKMGVLSYRNMKYQESLGFLRRALSIDTYSGEANYYYGLVNIALGKIADAKDGLSVAALSVDFRNAAYTGLARIFANEKDYAGTISYGQKALNFNRANIDAMMLLAVAYRYSGAMDKAGETLRQISAIDPLNHFVRFELSLSGQPAGKSPDFMSLIRNEMPQETLAELAIWYYRTGCISEAKAIFSLSPRSPEAAYWLSFLEGKKVACDDLDKDQVFPFRSETAGVLEALLQHQDDWLPKYHLALIYHDRGRLEESRHLLSSCGDMPGYAPFYATRSLVFEKVDEKRSLEDLQRAVAIDPAQWRYQKMLTEYYNNNGQQKNGLATIERFYRKVPSNYIIGMLYAKTLVLNGRYQQADKLLSKLDILPFEGATEGRDLYRESKLMQAVNLIQEHQYKAALEFIEAARQWPENLGAGKPYDEDIDMRLEDWMQYVCHKNLGKADTTLLLKRIQHFIPYIDNTVRNFIPSNALISAKAIELLSGYQEALNWLKEQEKDFPEIQNTLKWSEGIFLGRTPGKEEVSKEKDTSIRVILELLKRKFL